MFCKNTYALDINISSSSFDLLNSSSFSSLKEFADTKLSSDTSYNGYDILFWTSNSTYYLYLYKYYSFSDFTLNSGASRIDYKIRLNSEYPSKIKEVYIISDDVITLSSSSSNSPATVAGIINYSLTPVSYQLLYHHQLGNGSYNYISSTPITFYF